jgi:hypothetical protein
LRAEPDQEGPRLTGWSGTQKSFDFKWNKKEATDVLSSRLFIFILYLDV